MQPGQHLARWRQRGERRALNGNPLSAAVGSVELGAQDLGNILLKVREVRDQLQLEYILTTFYRNPGNNAGSHDRDGLVMNVNAL